MRSYLYEADGDRPELPVRAAAPADALPVGVREFRRVPLAGGEDNDDGGAAFTAATV